MTLINADLIEKGAEAIELAMWDSNSSENLARACLEAVLPDVIEACAKVAEQEADADQDDCGGAARRAAGAIRSLVSQEKE
jgi:hypothetical protein